MNSPSQNWEKTEKEKERERDSFKTCHEEKFVSKSKQCTIPITANGENQ